jgi:hypothetical protein
MGTESCKHGRHRVEVESRGEERTPKKPTLPQRAKGERAIMMDVKLLLARKSKDLTICTGIQVPVLCGSPGFSSRSIKV